MSTITSTQSKASALVHVQALMAGTEKRFPNGSFTLGNTAYTTASLVQAFKALADALTVLAAAHASTRDAVTAVRDAETKVARFCGTTGTSFARRSAPRTRSSVT